MFANEVRYRTLARLFGCPRDQANLLTLVAMLAVAEAMRERWQRLATGPMMPSARDAMLGVASFREGLLGVAGPSLRDKPQLGTLLMIAFLGRAAGPTVIRWIRVMRTGSQRLNDEFRGRYGYVVDVGRRRQRHYEELVRRRVRERQSAQQERPYG
jgi:hypothetical protein